VRVCRSAIEVGDGRDRVSRPCYYSYASHRHAPDAAALAAARFF